MLDHDQNKGFIFDIQKFSIHDEEGIRTRSEEHTSESSHARISYAVFCLKKKR